MNSDRIHVGRVLPIETHGHTAVVSFGFDIVPDTLIEISNHNRSYGVHRLSSGRFHGFDFELVAALFVRDELEKDDLLERWVSHHASIGVEHFLIYVNSPKAMNISFIQGLYVRFPENVTFVPFWFGHWVYLGDQQSQNMDALYTFKGVAKWMLSIDVDEYVICKNDLRKMLNNAESPTNAFQLTSYTVDNNGKLSQKPMYSSLYKGKVIINTQTVTGHSVHMVTDIIGGNHRHTDMCLLAHFHRTLDQIYSFNFTHVY